MMPAEHRKNPAWCVNTGRGRGMETDFKADSTSILRNKSAAVKSRKNEGGTQHGTV